MFTCLQMDLEGNLLIRKRVPTQATQVIPADLGDRDSFPGKALGRPLKAASTDSAYGRESGQHQQVTLYNGAQFHHRALLHTKPACWIRGLDHIGITADHNAQRIGVGAGTERVNHLIRLKTQRKESVPCRAVIRHDAKVRAAAVTLFKLNRVMIEALERMNRRRRLQDLGLVISRKSEIQPKMRFHRRYDNAPIISSTRSRTLLTRTGSCRRLPSSIRGISLSNAGPE